MKLITYSDVPQNAFRTVKLPQPAFGVLVENNANVSVTVLDDMGRNANTVPPGLTIGWNYPEGLYTPQVGCIGAYQGNARVYFYDGQLDLQGNPPTQQPPGSVQISGGNISITGGTIDLEPGTIVNVGTMPAVNIGTIPAVNIATLPAITGTVQSIPQGTTPVSGTFIDPNVAANTGALLGLLTRFTSFFTLFGLAPTGSLHTETVANPVAGFGLTSFINGAGRLNVYVKSGTQVIPLVRDRFFYASPLGKSPVEKRFATPVAAGDSINVQWDDANVNATFVLRY